MADVHTPAQRSFNMSRVRSKNTKPELIVRQFLRAHGFRYRLHDKKLPHRRSDRQPGYGTAQIPNSNFRPRLLLPRTRWLPILRGSQNPHRLVA